MTIQFHLDDDLKASWLHQRDLMLQKHITKGPIEAQAELERMQILRNQDQILALIKKEETDIMATLDDLVTAVAAEKTVADSAVSLLNGIAAQLAAAIAANDPAKVQAVLDGINANKQELADAVTANTPAAPTT